MGNTPSIKLTYFDFQGVAEKVRLALTVQEIEFEDERVSWQDWKALKPNTKYGQLPQMTINGEQTVTQSDAMLKYVARLKSSTLYPKDELEQLKVDEVLGLVGDFIRAWAPNLYVGMRPEKFGHPEGSNKTEEGKARTKAMRQKFVTDELPQWMGYFGDLLAEGKFLCGEELTIADLAFLPTIARFSTSAMDFVEPTTLDAYPVITAWIARVRAVPQIAAWYAPKPKPAEEKEEKEKAALLADVEGLTLDGILADGVFQVEFKDNKVSSGNVLPTEVTHTAPTVTFTATGTEGKKYTLIKTDPDAIARSEPIFREFIHWAVSDLTAADLAAGNSANGTTVLDYVGAGAPCNSGLHRYIFLLFEQPDGATPASLAQAFEGRGGKKAVTAAAAAGLGPVVAMSYYQAEWGEANDALHKAINFLPPAKYRSPAQIAEQEALEAAQVEAATAEE